MPDFHYTCYAQEIIFAPDALTRVSEAIDRFGWKKLLLCSTGSARRNGIITQIETALGERLVAIYEHVQPHVLDVQVAEVLALAAEHKIDAVIGLGGGSSIGMAKAVSQAYEAHQIGRPARATFPTEQPRIPVVAIPTTYAGSEMTPVYGVTHYEDGTTRKITVNDPKVTPKLTIYDPLLTLNLPPEITASTGINALAHCVEAIYSIRRNPLSTAAALAGIQHIVRALPRCYNAGIDLDARTEMLIGSFLAATALSNVAMAIHHGLCHVLGGTAGVAHGIANSIMLPHAMRFNLDTTTAELALVAEAMKAVLDNDDPKAAAEAGIQKVQDLVKYMNLPQRLRDAGVREGDLPMLAEIAFQTRTVHNNPRPITAASELEGVLRAAW